MVSIMKKMLSIGVLAISGIAYAMPATADDGWYASLGAGINIFPDSDINSSTFGVVDVEHSLNTGPLVLGAIGKELSSGLRVEGELSYRNNDYDDITVSINQTIFGTALSATTALSGDTSTFGFMANVAQDFNLKSKSGRRIHPFVLGGLGFATVSVNDATALSTLLADDTDTVFAYQAGAGINYGLTEKLSAGVSYRLFGTSDPGFTAVDGTSFDIDVLNHSLLVGLTRNF